MFADYYLTQHLTSAMCDSQLVSTLVDRQGHKVSNFCKSPAQQDRSTASEAESWGQGEKTKRGPTLAAGWVRGRGSGPCQGGAAKQEGLTTQVQLLFYKQRLCLCSVADPAALTVVSGYDSLPWGCWREEQWHTSWCDKSTLPPLAVLYTGGMTHIMVEWLPRSNRIKEGAITAIPTAGDISITAFVTHIVNTLHSKL